MLIQGRIQDFHVGGGGAKDYVPARTLWARNRTHFRQGSRARLRTLEALCFNALSCYIWALFLSILIRKIWLKNILDPILGGGGAHLLHPPRISHCYLWRFKCNIENVYDMNIKHKQNTCHLSIKTFNSFTWSANLLYATRGTRSFKSFPRDSAMTDSLL